MELSQDVNHRPIIFIRFNPDDFKINNDKVKSCWYKSKSGNLYIPNTKEEEWNNRLNTLKEQMSYWMQPENKTDKTIEVIQLFFDQ